MFFPLFNFSQIHSASLSTQLYVSTMKFQASKQPNNENQNETKTIIYKTRNRKKIKYKI